jgi:hypothetical protein
MAGFFTTLFKSDQMSDGSRRAALENVSVAREGLERSTNKLLDTINDMLRENDRVTKRQSRDALRK